MASILRPSPSVGGNSKDFIAYNSLSVGSDLIANTDWGSLLSCILSGGVPNIVYTAGTNSTTHATSEVNIIASTACYVSNMSDGSTTIMVENPFGLGVEAVLLIAPTGYTIPAGYSYTGYDSIWIKDILIPLAATVSLNPTSLSLGSAIAEDGASAITSNQTSLSVAVGDDTWLSAGINKSVLTVATIAENTTGSARTQQVTVTAGTGTNTATAILTVTQASA